LRGVGGLPLVAAQFRDQRGHAGVDAGHQPISFLAFVARLVRETTIWGTKMGDGRWGIKESELRRFLSGRPESKQRAKEK
jgi:hypothetical protein